MLCVELVSDRNSMFRPFVAFMYIINRPFSSNILFKIAFNSLLRYLYIEKVKYSIVFRLYWLSTKLSFYSSTYDYLDIDVFWWSTVKIELNAWDKGTRPIHAYANTMSINLHFIVILFYVSLILQFRNGLLIILRKTKQGQWPCSFHFNVCHWNHKSFALSMKPSNV